MHHECCPAPREGSSQAHGGHRCRVALADERGPQQPLLAAQVEVGRGRAGAVEGESAIRYKKKLFSESTMHVVA